MEYSKPKVVKLGRADRAVRGQTFKGVAPADNKTSNEYSTVPAYEADE